MELGGGLTVITGETGAGKSILVDALALLAGGRAIVRPRPPRRRAADGLRRVRDRRGVARDPRRRRPARRRTTRSSSAASSRADGRGRAFVEDEPAAGAHARAARRAARRDPRAGLGAGAGRLRRAARAPRRIREDRTRSGRPPRPRPRVGGGEGATRGARGVAQGTATERLDMLEFQIREIEAVRPGARRGRASPDRAREAPPRGPDPPRRRGRPGRAVRGRGVGGRPARRGVPGVRGAGRHRPGRGAHRDEAEELKRRIADLAAAARDAADSIEADPERLPALETRLDGAPAARAQVRRLRRGAPVARLEAWKAERAELSDIDDALERRQREEEKAREAYRSAARALSLRREAAASKLSAAVEKELRGARARKRRASASRCRPGRGTSRARPGWRPPSFSSRRTRASPRSRSSGSRREASCPACSSRSAASRRGGAVAGRTLVFDEVDAGIGGRVAEVVGRRLRDLAAHDQVLCVTHVPQIAALADAHFRAEKREVKGRTVAAVRRLDGRERVAEIARMLAGEKRAGDRARARAKTLLEAAR